MSEIYKTVPGFAPQPHAYGKCIDDDAHFFLCDYLNLSVHNANANKETTKGEEKISEKGKDRDGTSRLPDPVCLGKKLAELHHKSQSPTEKFGFHCVTFDGKLPLNTTWNSNWTSFFTRLIRDVYSLDVDVNGFWRELDEVMQVTLEKLIPRLLNPLTANGRTIKPCLIHGDL